MKITMLRNLAKKPGADPKDDRLEGQTYTVKDAEGKELVKLGLAVEGDELPDVEHPPVMAPAQPPIPVKVVETEKAAKKDATK